MGRRRTANVGHGGPDIPSVGTAVTPEQQRPSEDEATPRQPGLTPACTGKEVLVPRGTPAWSSTRHPR